MVLNDMRSSSPLTQITGLAKKINDQNLIDKTYLNFGIYMTGNRFILKLLPSIKKG